MGLWAGPYYTKYLQIKLSRKAAIARNLQKFSPAKVSGYTVHVYYVYVLTGQGQATGTLRAGKSVGVEVGKSTPILAFSECVRERESD